MDFKNKGQFPVCIEAWLPSLPELPFAYLLLVHPGPALLIQVILNRTCVSCHEEKGKEGVSEHILILDIAWRLHHNLQYAQ